MFYAFSDSQIKIIRHGNIMSKVQSGKRP